MMKEGCEKIRGFQILITTSTAIVFNNFIDIYCECGNILTQDYQFFIVKRRNVND